MFMRKPGVIEDWGNDVGYLQRAFLPSQQKKKAGNGFTVSSPSANSNNGGFTMAKGTNNVGAASVGQANQNTIASGMSSVLMAARANDNMQPGGAVPAAAAATSGGTNNTGGATGGGSTGGAGQQQQPMTFESASMGKAYELMTQLEKMMNDGFQYNYQTDPGYLAAVQASKEHAKTASDSTLQQMSDRGILNSSITSNQLGQIQQDAEKAPLQLVPQLEANAYGRYSDKLSSVGSLMNTFLQQGQWESNRADNERWKDAEVTGTYESPEFKKLFDTLISAKQGWGGTTDPNERNKFAQTGKDTRAALAALTGRTPAEIDKLYGGSVGIDGSKANYTLGGVETAAAKAARLNQDNYVDERKYNRDQDTKQWGWKDKEWTESVRHNKAMESKGSGGSGGPSESSINRLLSQNTFKMVGSMVKEGIKDEQGAWAWINDPKHYGEVYSGQVNPDDLVGYFKKNSGGDPASKGPDDYAIWADAEKAAQKDARVKFDSRGNMLISNDQYDKIVQEWHDKFHKRAYPPKPATPLTEAEKKRTKDVHKANWLETRT